MSNLPLWAFTVFMVVLWAVLFTGIRIWIMYDKEKKRHP